jgi:large subunit ribosomal protein L4
VELQVVNQAGKAVKTVQASDYVFAAPFNEAVVHQALVRQLANARQGTACTKTRGEVSGSSRKLFRQKHTGNARAGSIKNPLRRGGGVTFGPKPRDYRQAMPKKMRQLALRCVLSDKVRHQMITVIDAFDLADGRTAEMSQVLGNLKLDRKTLIATAEPEAKVIRAAANLVGVKTMPVHTLNVADVLGYRYLLLTKEALEKAEQLWGAGQTEEAK